MRMHVHVDDGSPFLGRKRDARQGREEEEGGYVK